MEALGAFVETAGDPIDTLSRGIADSSHIARLATAPGHETDDTSGPLIAYVGTGIAYVGAGVADGADDTERLRALRATAEATGGALVLERASIDQKRALGVWGTARMPAAIAAALKRRFDPRDVLAPGRMPVT